jgi:hypothetical protein
MHKKIKMWKYLCFASYSCLTYRITYSYKSGSKQVPHLSYSFTHGQIAQIAIIGTGSFAFGNSLLFIRNGFFALPLLEQWRLRE